MSERILSYIMDELVYYKNEHKKSEEHLTQKISDFYALELENKKLEEENKKLTDQLAFFTQGE